MVLRVNTIIAQTHTAAPHCGSHCHQPRVWFNTPLPVAGRAHSLPHLRLHAVRRLPPSIFVPGSPHVLSVSSGRVPIICTSISTCSHFKHIFVAGTSFCKAPSATSAAAARVRTTAARLRRRRAAARSRPRHRSVLGSWAGARRLSYPPFIIPHRAPRGFTQDPSTDAADEPRSRSPKRYARATSRA